jgi:hypothetical protein
VNGKLRPRPFHASPDPLTFPGSACPLHPVTGEIRHGNASPQSESAAEDVGALGRRNHEGRSGRDELPEAMDIDLHGIKNQGVPTSSTDQ